MATDSEVYDEKGKQGLNEIQKSVQAGKTRIDMGDHGSITAQTRPPSSYDQSSLRQWWHEILRGAHGFSCYGIFLALPGDKEVLNYLIEYGVELDIISRSSCLIIFLGGIDFTKPKFEADSWSKTVNNHVGEGHSAKLANFLEIEYSEFPCLIFFQDIRSANYIRVDLNAMSAEEIAQRMRTVFSLLRQVIHEGNDPISSLKRHQMNEGLLNTGKTIVSEVQGLAGKSLEAAMEAWIKATIK